MLSSIALAQVVASVLLAGFAVAVLAGGERRLPHVYLATFLALVATNQGIEAFRDSLPRERFGTLFVVGTVMASFDPLVLLLFAATFPRRGSLARGPALPAALVASGALALTAIVWSRPIPGESFAAQAHAAALRVYTAAAYVAVLLSARRRLAGGEHAGSRLLYAALLVATIPSLVRFPLLALGPLPPTAGFAAAIPIALVGLVAAVALAWIASRPPPGTSRSTRGAILAATLVSVGLALLIESYQIRGLLGFAGVDVWLVPAAGTEAFLVAARWAAFGLLASLAVLRHDLLGLPLEARRRGARVLVGLVAVAAAAVSLSLLAPLFPEAGVELTVVELAIVLAVLVASGAFRGLVSRLASAAYGVPMPAVGADALERYRVALAHARTDADALAQLPAVRAQIGLDAATAAVLERMAGDSGSAPLSAGETVGGRYRVVRLLGRGGHARAFLARDLLLSRDVVLKEATGEGAGLAQREARLASSLAHPNVVRLYDALRRDEGALLVLEYVAGGSLADRLAEQGPLPLAEATAVVEGVLAGLAAVHAAGVVHRDLKPANVLLAADGSPRIADFGVARARREATLGVGAIVVGTLASMAPEQRRGEPATAASDVFAVGLLARRCVAEHWPPRCERVLARALTEDPAGRYADGAAMLAAWRDAVR